MDVVNILLYDLVPSKFKIKDKEEKKKIEESKPNIGKTLNKRQELKKNKSTIFDSEIIQVIK